MSGTARLRFLCGGLAIALMAMAGPANAVVCTIGPAGSLPPQCFEGGGYLSPNDVHMIIDGLPVTNPPTEILLGAEHLDFFNIAKFPDGMGGETENFSSALIIHLQGTGMLATFNGDYTMSTQDQTHTDPHNPADPVQSFDTEMLGIQGQIIGDPDFDLLRITAGTAFGMPSPGHTTLTRLPGGNYNVDSFFDITYRIDFVGNPTGRLGGMSGSTTGTIRMQAGQPIPEPATLCLFGLGVIGMLGLARRRNSYNAQ